MNLEIEKTADGSPTLYRRDIDEHYHSVKGALAESRHVYVDLGWRKATLSGEPVIIFEVGFGTGLNAALTAKAAFESEIKTIYYSVELNPLPKDTTDSLLPFQEEDYQPEFKAVNEAVWGKAVKINTYFTIVKIQDDLVEMPVPENISAVYFDAFAPEKQPEMWNEEVFSKIFKSISPGGVLTTYCAKGRIRRMLQKIGFLTERLPGPPEGKREVLRATKRTLGNKDLPVNLTLDHPKY